jgi:hypothetical protein
VPQCKVTINELHILLGQEGCCVTCPVALGIKDLLVPEAEVRVDHEGIDLYLGEQAVSLPLSPRISKKIQMFDNTGIMGPFTFDLDIPKEFLACESK